MHSIVFMYVLNIYTSHQTYFSTCFYPISWVQFSRFEHVLLFQGMLEKHNIILNLIYSWVNVHVWAGLMLEYLLNLRLD